MSTGGRRAAAAALLLLSAWSTGCYAYQRYEPSQAGALPGGSVVEVAVTDRGRVALADSLGAGALSVRGRLVAASDTALSVRVERVEYLRGTSSRWAGEEVTIRRDYVASLADRRLARGRTLAVASVVVGGIVAFLVSRALTGEGGSDAGDRPRPGPDPEQ